MNTGLHKIRPDHRDFDWHLTFGATIPASGIPDFDVDAKLWTPNQNYPEKWGNITTPALPYGCTDYIQTDLVVDEDKQLYDPMKLENITHANANGGCDIRTSLSATRKLYNRPAYFSIRPSRDLDWFDAVRVTLYSTKDDRRSASIGSQWFYDFLYLELNNIVPMPMNLAAYSWHNWKISGQRSFNGVPHLICKPLLGRNYGDNGFCYMRREVFNYLMSRNGTAAFTLANPVDKEIQTVDLSIIGVIVSFVLRLLKL